MVEQLRLGSLLLLKKRHACGSEEWQVYRVGADVGIKCLGCGRRVLLPRSRLQQRMRGGPIRVAKTDPRSLRGSV